MTAKSKPCIGITLGDPAGIGPEVIAKTLSDPRLPKGFRFEVLGASSGIHSGRSTQQSARIALQALENAVNRCKSGSLAAVVTGPVQKETLSKVGFPFPGQTEFFAARCKLKSSDVVMMMFDKKLKVSLCSTHCSMRDALHLLTPKKIIHTVMLTHAFLRSLGIKEPKIAIAGVNPHAGENGLFGTEEIKIIAPAVRQLRFLRVNVFGPYSPDTVFYNATNGAFDAVVAMYHDQGLIPFKLLAFSSGVNVTLGLPIIRTSPDHGTALDVAGTAQADASSLRAAIHLAIRMQDQLI